MNSKVLQYQLSTSFHMANEKFTLTWHSYASHFQEVLGQLFDSEESSDVTLISDDQVKFKAHKFVLKACSPVFESILQDTNDAKSIVYLRGVNQFELRPILEFIYSGQASFYQERMKEFLRVGKDLQIKEIKEVPDEDENKENVENYSNPEETFSDDIDSVNEQEIGSSATNETQQISVPSNSTQCPQCDAMFVHRRSMLAHVRYKHEGVKYPCNQCDHKAAILSNLRQHIESVHEGVKYPCSQCDYKATTQNNLRQHIESLHEGVKYPCSKCDYKATTQRHLRRHMKAIHKY